MSLISSYSDRDLLQLLSEGDHSAFEEIWNRYWELGYNTAYKRLKDEQLSKDAVQDIFTDLWVRRSKLDVKNLPAYINSAVQYKVYKLLAKKPVDTPFFEVFETMAITAVGADGKIIEKELAELAEAWLNSLPEKRKQIFILHYRDNLSTKKISDLLHISQKTVQNQLGLATNSLHEKLRPVYIFLLQAHVPLS